MSAAFPLTPDELSSGRVVRVMSLGREDFFRMLPGAVELPIVHRGDGAQGRGWVLQVSVQAAHWPQGFDVMPVSQLRLLARMREIVVLPTPRVPVNR